MGGRSVRASETGASVSDPGAGTLPRPPGQRGPTFGSLAVVLCAAAMALPGCARSAAVEGKPIAAEAVARIVPGHTTEAEIREWFGPPAEVVFTDHGKVLTYRHHRERSGLLSLPFLGIGGGVSSGQLLLVTVGDAGRVLRHTFVAGP